MTAVYAERLHPRDRLGRWAHVLHAPKPDYTETLAPGLKYKANLGNEARNNLGEILVGPKFFALKPDQRHAVLAHEIGHDYDDALLTNPETAWVWDEHEWLDADGVPLNGRGASPGERIADAISALLTDDHYSIARWPAIARIGRELARLTEASEVADLLEVALWDTLKHPRGRGGKWVDKVGGEVAHAVEQKARALDRPAIVRKERPLQQSEAFRRARTRPSYHTEFGRHGDEFMYDLAVDRGYAGRPHVVSEDELKQHIADGDKEMWRGVSDESYAQTFTTGTAFYGQGFRGNGIYAAHGERAKALATAYAQAPPTRGVLVQKVDKPVLIHMALRRDAKVIHYDEAAIRARSEHTKWAGLKSGGEGLSAQGAQAMAAAHATATRWALAHGYDAVVIPKEDGGEEVAVLNRTALIVAGEFQSAGENVTQRIHEADEGDED